MKIEKLSEFDHWDLDYKYLLNNKSYLKKILFESYSDKLFWKYCMKYLPKKIDAKILEIGSAPGFRLVDFHQKMNYEPYGIEYSENGCELNKIIFFANKINPKNVLCEDFFSEELHKNYKNYFDLVVSFGFIEHFVNAGEVIEKHVNLLKPGGTLMITIPNFKGINLTLSKFFTEKEVLDIHNFEIMEIEIFEKLFQNKGLETCYCNYYGTFDFSLVYYKRKKLWKDLIHVTLAMSNIALSYLFIFLFRKKSPENRNFSPYILYIGKKTQ